MRGIGSSVRIAVSQTFILKPSEGESLGASAACIAVPKPDFDGLGDHALATFADRGDEGALGIGAGAGEALGQLPTPVCLD